MYVLSWKIILEKWVTISSKYTYSRKFNNSRIAKNYLVDFNNIMDRIHNVWFDGKRQFCLPRAVKNKMNLHSTQSCHLMKLEYDIKSNLDRILAWHKLKKSFIREIHEYLVMKWHPSVKCLNLSHLAIGLSYLRVGCQSYGRFGCPAPI